MQESFHLGSSDLTPESLSAAGVPRLTLRELANAVRSAASLQVRGSFGDRMELTLRDIARQLDEHAATRLEPIGYASRAAIRNIQLGIQERAAIVPKSEAVDDGDDVPVYFAAAETSKTEGLGQMKQMDPSPLSPSLKSLEGKNKPALWQWRWANPANDPSRSDDPDCRWTEVVLRASQTLEQRIEELRAYRFDGKPCYEVRPLYTEQSSGVQTPGNSNGGKVLSDERAEALIEASDGHWREDVFCIGGPELMALLRAAASDEGA